MEEIRKDIAYLRDTVSTDNQLTAISKIVEYTLNLEEKSIPVDILVIGQDELYCTWYKCSSCDYEDIQITDKYCGGCGKPITPIN